MTDRVNALVVTLDGDYRIDDVQSIIDALYMIKGIVHVEENVSDVESHVAYSLARSRISNKLFKVLSED